MSTIHITKIDHEQILFSDGSRITFDHPQDCCEYNYADFKQLDDLARSYKFQRPLSFESAEGGFRFGDSRRKFYVPCYSDQNGYYTTEVDIYYTHINKGLKPVLMLEAQYAENCENCLDYF